MSDTLGVQLKLTVTSLLFQRGGGWAKDSRWCLCRERSFQCEVTTAAALCQPRR